MDVEIIESASHHCCKIDNNLAYYHFSFADYYNPNKMNVGTLRVFNECQFQPNSPLGKTSLRDIELVTYVIEGELIYKNDKGIHETLRTGDVFTVSCGIGIISSGHFPVPTKLIEAWVFPSKYSLKPSFQKWHVDVDEYTNTILQIIKSEKKVNNVSGLEIHQDTNLYITRLGPGKDIEYQSEPERKMYLFIMSGKISINNKFELGNRDAAKITFSSSETLHFVNMAHSATDIMLIDLAIN